VSVPNVPSCAAARPTAGVAICVYNGARYLRTQLESIASQTELPKQAVVVDDGSTDGSWDLLQAWAASAPFPVRLERNEQNLGVVRNFEKAVRLLLPEVDIVFFSDQDDQWYPGKVAAFVDAFAADPQLGLVHSDADLVDPEGKPLDSRLFTALLVTEREREAVAAGEAWRAYVRRNLVTGAACACRSSVLERALPFSEVMIHDEWVAFVASLVSGIRMIEQPWMAYRLHGANTVGLPIPNFFWWARTVLQALLTPQVPTQLARLARLQALRERALEVGASGQILAAIDQAITHAAHRSSLPRNPFRRAAAVRRHWKAGEYHQWSSGDISMLHDLLIAT
jgi:glycosyltransferase involved in cell wall biosynthesis